MDRECSVHIVASDRYKSLQIAKQRDRRSAPGVDGPAGRLLVSAALTTLRPSQPLALGIIVPSSQSPIGLGLLKTTFGRAT